VVVTVKDRWSGVAGDVDIGPAIVVVVERGDRETVVAVGTLEAAGPADIFELSAAQVVIQNIRCAGKAARTAHDGNAFPHATGASTRLGNCCEIEVNVVGGDDVKFAVAVVVDEGTAGSPFLPSASYSGLLRYLFESTVALIVIEVVLAVAGDVEVVEAIVIVVAHADSLAPTGGGKARVGRDVGEGAVVVIVEEMAGGLSVYLRGCHGGAVNKEDVGPAVAVVIEDSYAGACCLDDVALGINAAIDVSDDDTGFGRDVNEPGWRWMVGGRGVGLLPGRSRDSEERECERRERQGAHD
jgi:hypothetical protein